MSDSVPQRVDHPNPAPQAYRTFWQHPFVQYLMPFLTSLSLHAGIVVLVVLAATVIRGVVYDQRPAVQITVPDMGPMHEQGPSGGIPDPLLDRTKPAAQDQFPDVPKDSRGWADRPGPDLRVSLMGGGASGHPLDEAIIGIGSGAGSGKGTGSGRGDGFGNGEGGALAPFGTPGGGGAANVGFVRQKDRANRIVYLCDASGTMLNVFDNLRVELHKSIENLKGAQSFNVVFFQDDNALVLEKNGLLMATPENKKKAYDFIDRMVSRGSTNPIPAIRAAFASNPELIYCLTDGFDAVSSFDAVADEFRGLNKGSKVKVNTLLIESSDLPELKAILQKIARESGGSFKALKEGDL